MDALPPQPNAFEQSIKDKLIGCGLGATGISVSYQSDLQGYEVRISPAAGATSQHFECIEAASAREYVTFTEEGLQKDYLLFVAAKYRPFLLERAKEDLARRGLLEGLPTRSAYTSDKLFVEAIEQHCGLSKGSAIKLVGSGYVFQPRPSEQPDIDALSEKYGCLLAAIQVVSGEGGLEIAIGFTGNEAFSPNP